MKHSEPNAGNFSRNIITIISISISVSGCKYHNHRQGIKKLNIQKHYLHLLIPEPLNPQRHERHENSDVLQWQTSEEGDWCWNDTNPYKRRKCFAYLSDKLYILLSEVPTWYNTLFVHQFLKTKAFRKIMNRKVYWEWGGPTADKRGGPSSSLRIYFIYIKANK